MKTNLTVLINHYWEKRIENIGPIIDALKDSSVRPDRVIIFCNYDENNIGSPNDWLTVVKSSYNFGYRAAYMASLLLESKYFLVQDDDVAVERNTLQNFMQYCDKSSRVFGLWGKDIGRSSQPYTKHKQTVKSQERKTARLVDILIGKGLMFFDRQCVLNMLKLEQALLGRFDYSREQDILMSMANASFVIPTKEGEGYIDLGECGVGYNREKGHYQKRDWLVEAIVSL